MDHVELIGVNVNEKKGFYKVYIFLSKKGSEIACTVENINEQLFLILHLFEFQEVFVKLRFEQVLWKGWETLTLILYSST